MSDSDVKDTNPGQRAYRLPSLFSLLLHEVSRLRRNLLDKVLRPLGITRTQTLLLATLSNLQSGSCQQDLSVAMNTSKVNVAAMLNLLGASGYLERKNDLSDKRVKVLSITAEGYAALDQATEKARLIDAELIAGIDPDRLKVAEDVLNQIKANILKLGDEETASQLYS